MIVEIEIDGRKYGFAYNSKTDYNMGIIKRELGFQPNDDVDFLTQIHIRHYAALRAFGLLKNGLSDGLGSGVQRKFDFDSWLELSDRIIDADQDLLMEASNKGLGFSQTIQRKMMEPIAEQFATSLLVAGMNGKNTGNTENAQPLAD